MDGTIRAAGRFLNNRSEQPQAAGRWLGLLGAVSLLFGTVVQAQHARRVSSDPTQTAVDRASSQLVTKNAMLTYAGGTELDPSETIVFIQDRSGAIRMERGQTAQSGGNRLDDPLIRANPETATNPEGFNNGAATWATLPNNADVLEPAPAWLVPMPYVQQFAQPHPLPKFWVGAEYLYWKLQGSPLPPLFTTAPAELSREEAGVLGRPQTTVLFGGTRVADDFRHGARIHLGFSFDPERTVGVESSFFVLDSDDTSFEANADGTSTLARPFFDVSNNEQSSDLIGLTDILAGTGRFDLTSEVFGAEALLRCTLLHRENWQVETLGGYRFLAIDEDLRIAEVVTAIRDNNLSPAGSSFFAQDSFDTENRFHGLQLGLRGRMNRGRFFGSLTGKVALGGTQQIVAIEGFTDQLQPGAPVTRRPTGLFGQLTNSGVTQQTQFAVLPELSVRLGTRLGNRWQAYVGYDFLLLSSALRVGDQIDLRINPTQVPPSTLQGPALPEPILKESSVWLQGLTAGVEFHY